MALFNVEKAANNLALEELHPLRPPLKRQFPVLPILGLSLLALWLVYGLPVAKAAVHFTVTTPNDNGPGSLRQAILDLNAAASGYYYIDFDSQLEGATITLQSALPTITNSVGFNDTRFNSNTPHRVKIDGQGLYRLFTSTATTTRFYYMDLVNGYANQNSPQGAFGGALYFSPDMHADIAYCNFINNQVESNLSGGTAAGGAVYFGPRPFGLIGYSTFTNNSAKGTGGATAQGGAYWGTGVDLSYVIYETQFNQNSATADNTNASGGAVYLSNSNYLKIYQNSSFTGNYTSGTTNYPNTYSSGGAISLVASTMTISQTTFTGNIAAKTATGLNSATSNISSQGGAIFSADNSSLTLEVGSDLENNLANFGQGGGLWSNGPVAIIGASFSTNTAYLAGGGFYSYYGSSDIRRSTFWANTTSSTGFDEGNGGAIYTLNNAVILANSTLSANMASGYGGGVFQNAGNSSIYNSTITLNSAARGGGLDAASNNIYLQNTILAQNTAPGNFGPNFYNSFSGSFTSGGNNLIDNTGSTNTTITPAAGDKFNAASQPLNLGPLQDNGGPTLTHHPLSGSQAINTGNNTACSNTYANSIDQRGVKRPYNLACDIGAVEVVMLEVNDAGDEGDYTDDGDCLTSHGVCTLRAALEQPFPTSVPIWINFSVIGTEPVKIKPGQALPTLSNPVYLDGTSPGGVSCGVPSIELDGSLLAANPAVAGLTLGVGSAYSTIRGLAINRFSGPALEVGSANNTLSCSQLGLRVNGNDPAGTNAGGAITISSGGQLAVDGSDKIGGTLKIQSGKLEITNPVVVNVNNN